MSPGVSQLGERTTSGETRSGSKPGPLSKSRDAEWAACRQAIPHLHLHHVASRRPCRPVPAAGRIPGIAGDRHAGTRRYPGLASSRGIDRHGRTPRNGNDTADAAPALRARMLPATGMRRGCVHRHRLPATPCQPTDREAGRAIHVLVALDHATHALGRDTPATSDRLNHPVRYRRLERPRSFPCRRSRPCCLASVTTCAVATYQLRCPFVFGVTTHSFFTEAPCHRIPPAVASSRAWPQAAPLQAWASGRGKRGR